LKIEGRRSRFLPCLTGTVNLTDLQAKGLQYEGNVKVPQIYSGSSEDGIATGYRFPDCRQSGSLSRDGLRDINRNLPEEDFWPGRNDA
jgi:hypothetical protein